MEGDPFLHDSWKHKAESEHEPEMAPETQEDRDFALYERFDADAQNHPVLHEATAELEKAIGRYAESVTALSYAKSGKLSKDVLIAADNHRRLCHNSLIDSLNLLSREYKKLGIDNTWRSAIIGDSRREAGDWALSVARTRLNRQ